MEHWRNDTERRRPKYQTENVSQCTLSTKRATLTTQRAWMEEKSIQGFD